MCREGTRRRIHEHIYIYDIYLYKYVYMHVDIKIHRYIHILRYSAGAGASGRKNACIASPVLLMNLIGESVVGVGRARGAGPAQRV